MRGCSCRGASGFVHVSCLVRQAKILVAEAEENNLEIQPRWDRWHTCSLCEQSYHGVVRCALGWACWKTYVGWPEADEHRRDAMNVLGLGLTAAKHHEDALVVEKATLAMMRRLGASDTNFLGMQGNLAGTYNCLGRLEDASRIEKLVFSGYLKLKGLEHKDTIVAANNYSATLVQLKRYREVKALMRKMIPVARRVLGENNGITLRMRSGYANALYRDDDATLDDLYEAVTTLEETDRIARRVLGSAHPLVRSTEFGLRQAFARFKAFGEALKEHAAPAAAG